MQITSLADKIKKQDDKKREIQEKNSFGLYDQNKKGNELVDAFVKFELFKFKDNLEKSKSFYQLPNKSKMIFGGQVKLGLRKKKKNDNQ